MNASGSQGNSTGGVFAAKLRAVAARRVTQAEFDVSQPTSYPLPAPVKRIGLVAPYAYLVTAPRSIELTRQPSA